MTLHLQLFFLPLQFTLLEDLSVNPMVGSAQYLCTNHAYSQFCSPSTSLAWSLVVILSQHEMSLSYPREEVSSSALDNKVAFME